MKLAEQIGNKIKKQAKGKFFGFSDLATINNWYIE